MSYSFIFNHIIVVEPRYNRYIKYFDNIRVIQDHLCREADAHHVRAILL